ncbi:nuclear transport factor 2 family protein [uncultured Shimia sp.]|uniref:nuclear transport factor 2 family protein n=1 Tax=uncultured Shimia sp. TaxID=573152 RepID=UPI002605D293|nr:nuclear transport factor 2 family protein [uncultured Shimia sp.]
MSQVIDAFFAAWGETDPKLRAATLRRCLSDDVAYLDPRLTEPLKGIEAVEGYVAMYSTYAPGATAEVIQQTQDGQTTRASVAFRMSDETVQHGHYFIEADDQGRLTRLEGHVGLGETE